MINFISIVLLLYSVFGMVNKIISVQEGIMLIVLVMFSNIIKEE